MADQNTKKIIEDFLKSVPEMKSRPTLQIFDEFLEIIRREMKKQSKTNSN